MELTLSMIWSCLMRVPVRHWRVLFHYLCRLDATYRAGRAEGRRWLTWHVREDGVIWMSDWDLTEAERKRRCALPDGFDCTPWTRLEAEFDQGYLVRLAGALGTRLATRLMRSHALTALMLSAAIGLALSGAGTGGPLAFLLLHTFSPPHLPGGAALFHPP